MNWPLDIGIEPYYEDKYRVLFHGDCREVLPKIHGITSVITDPPYELGFMGKSWDSKGVSFDPATWWAVRQSCKPGAMMLSFGGTRTYHRIACAIEDAGWEIRDCIQWLYGTGFPKSMDVSKAIDKAKGESREVVGSRVSAYGTDTATGERVSRAGGGAGLFVGSSPKEVSITGSPASLESSLWNGWGTALKPAYEPIVLCMNPVDKTFANNALNHGVAGINIDGCRVPVEGDSIHAPQSDPGKRSGTVGTDLGISGASVARFQESQRLSVEKANRMGRFPANVVHDGSDEVVSLFPQSKGQQGDVRGTEPSRTGDENSHCYEVYGRIPQYKRGDTEGSAARFFYCAKSAKSERHNGGDKNSHPTVKPLALIKYLCKLVSYPADTLILDPFVGSGTTLLACAELGIKSIGIDSDEKSCDIAASRCAADSAARLARGEY